MRVKIAAQTLSTSVGNALKYMRQSTEYSTQFFGSKATEEFIFLFNNLFDILNTRNLFGKRYSQPLQRSTEEMVFSELVRAKNYILNLKDSRGKLICDSGRKVGFIGFLVCIESLISLYDEYILSQENQLLRFVLTYKLCQDHLEVFFSAIRSKGGHNNNPTARQFIAAYKKLLVHTEVTGSKYANCTELMEQSISILYVSSSICRQSILPVGCNIEEMEDVAREIECKNQQLSLIYNDHDYGRQNFESSTFISDVVSYIAGFVGKQVQKIIKCQMCQVALHQSEHPSILQQIKCYDTETNFGLFKASSDVIYLCRLGEKIFREHKKDTSINIDRLTLEVMRSINKPVFSSLNDHMFVESTLNNHVINLIKIVINRYLKIRFHYLTKTVNEELINNRIRSVLTKRILYSHQ